MNRSVAAASAAFLLSLFPCGDALAVAQRTFVSAIPGVGNDANTVANCSIALPCRSFGAALTVTAANGEIIVLDSGGYGRVTIDKSVVVTAPPGIYAGISVFSGTNGVDVLTGGITVVLRGLTINGQGGSFGVYVNAANVRLRIENCAIANFGGIGQTAVSVTGSATNDLSVKDTVIRDNSNGLSLSEGRVSLHRLVVERTQQTGVTLLGVRASVTDSKITGGGLGMHVAGGSGADTIVAIGNTAVADNTQGGILVYGGDSNIQVSFSHGALSGNGPVGLEVRLDGDGAIQTEIVGSVLKSNSGYGLQIGRTAGTTASLLTMSDNLVSGNSANGIMVSGSDVYAFLARNTITSNGVFGIAQVGGSVVETRGNNFVRGNNGGGDQTYGTIAAISGI
jgi:hypothetical protein